MEILKLKRFVSSVRAVVIKMSVGSTRVIYYVNMYIYDHVYMITQIGWLSTSGGH